MKYFFCTLFSILIVVLGNAQYNLVRNYSFEDSVVCPSPPLYNPLPSPWVQPSTWQVGAFVHKCSTDTGSSVPSHNFGGRKSFQYPKTGNGFAAIGIIAGSSSYRYYLQQKLKDSLMRNKYYYIEFWSSLGNPMKYACNNVAALLTKNKVSAQNLGVINSIPQIVNWGNPIISDTMNWVKVSSIFKAIGGEQYITLGNFFDYNNTVVSTFNVSGVESSEYYIDDVSVIPLDSFNLKADAGKDSLINAGDSVFIGSYTNGIDTLKWVNQNTTLAIDSTRPGFWVKPTSNTCYILTQTVNNFTSSDTVCISVRPLPLKFLEFSIFPSFGGVRGGFTTANEINVSHFNIQFSENGKDFYTIEKLAAKNQSFNHYEYMHQTTTNEKQEAFFIGLRV